MLPFQIKTECDLELGLILGAGGGSEAGEGGEDKPPRPDNWKKMANSQKDHRKCQGGKARKGEKVRLGS